MTLRNKVSPIDQKAIVAQRLKRAPSIILKLKRFEGMKLARMQDIAGLRAVVNSISMLKALTDTYRKSNFKHELISSKNYIDNPKQDGYRSIHLIYRYSNDLPQGRKYNGLSLELQLRTHLQHAWATAVETMGIYLGQALKSGQGESEWREFFRKSSAALAVMEKSAPIPGFENHAPEEIFEEIAQAEEELHVLEKLSNYNIATEAITTTRGVGAYHLVVLDWSLRKVEISPYPTSRLEEASLAYAKIEERTNNGEPIEAVLVAAGPLHSLRKAYPNYFLDTQTFVKQMRKVILTRRPPALTRKQRNDKTGFLPFDDSLVST